MLCLWKGLNHKMIGNGDGIHSPRIRLIDVFFNIADTIHFRKLGMHMQLHTFFLCFIHTLYFCNLFNHVRHKDKLPGIGIVFRLTIGYDTVSVLYFRQYFLCDGTAFKPLHDDGIVVIPDPQHLDITSIAQRSCFRFKDLTMDTDTMAFFRYIMNGKRHILVQPLFPLRLKIIAFLFLIHLHRLRCRLTFHRDRRNRCGFFHFLNMNFQLKAAALQKFLQQMLILDRPVAFLLIQNLIDKIFLFIDGRQ